MARTGSARRYAQAVFQIALERDGLDIWAEDLRVLATGLENRELAELLDAPQVPVATKVQMITEVLGDSVDDLARNLLAVLAGRSLAHLLPSVADEFSRLVDEHNGIARGEVVSAVPLTEAESERVNQVLSGIVGKPLRLTVSVDSGILGGVVARVGDRVIDGSVRTTLREMRRELVEQI